MAGTVASGEGAGRDGSDGLDRSLAAHALTLNDRFLREVVERFGICPFARQSREGGRVARWVVTNPVLSEQILDAIGQRLVAWGADETVEIGLLLFPAFDAGVEAFHSLVPRLTRALGQGGTGASPFVTATFHPEMPYSTDSPARFMPFFRRSPDPTIQLVRSTVLEAVRRNPSVDVLHFSADGWKKLLAAAAAVSTSDRIERDNYQLFTSGLVQEIEALQLELARERRARRRGA